MSGYRPLGGILHGQGIDVSISFSSGFSCQDAVNSVAFSPDGKDTMFPSRNRAAFHVRAPQSRMYHPWGTSVCFHLVIERLLMSGALTQLTELSLYDTLRFHLVLKRLFMSGLANHVFLVNPALVSISFSSGFSCQDHRFDTRLPETCVSISLSSGFSFQVTRKPYQTVAAMHVSISLSSGFSFQVRATPAPARYQLRFNLVIERLLISGSKDDARSNASGRFNLVIERLLISGKIAAMSPI